MPQIVNGYVDEYVHLYMSRGLLGTMCTCAVMLAMRLCAHACVHACMAQTARLQIFVSISHISAIARNGPASEVSYMFMYLFVMLLMYY